jgi:hypothetical protein
MGINYKKFIKGEIKEIRKALVEAYIKVKISI